MPGRRALVVGIDDYMQQPLSGCKADATEIASRLKTNADGSPNFDIKLLTGGPDDVTRNRLRSELKALFENPHGNDLLFYFSGHGTRTAFGAEVVTRELGGVSMGDLLTLANGANAASVTVILDCCFSGAVGNPAGLQAAQVAEQFRKEVTVLADGVTFLAASRATQVAWESAGHGTFTRLLLDGLDGGATDHTGRITALSLYAFASAALGAWDQRPIFKAHLTEPPVLRVGPPWLEPPVLRELTAHFTTPETRVSMTPEHEGEGRPLSAGQGTSAQQQFDYFKKLRNAGLLETDDDEDLYFAALNSHDVHLTALGRYFWDRVHRGRV